MFKKGKFDWEIVCTVCNSNISIAHKGILDINKHVATSKHKMRFRSQTGTSKSVMETYITKSEIADNIRAAEDVLAFHSQSPYVFQFIRLYKFLE